MSTVGGLALTVDIPLIRLANGEAWSILAVRSFTTFAAAILIWLVWRAFTDKVPSLMPGKAGLAVASLYGFGSITFITAVFSTSTANLVFILAFNTMFSSLLARIFLGERLRPATLLAMAAMIGGVAIIVWDSIGTGTLFGDFMALCSAFFIASAITITRASGRDMGFTPLVGVIFPALLALAFVAQQGYRIDAPGWILFNGAVMMPLAFFLLGAAPRYIPGGEVAMFYLLETVLAPVWVWLIFEERPTTNSLIGGTILVVALVAHSMWQLYDGRRQRDVPAQLPL
jgi:drug/metabolite transporter (DMT)-like permease